MGALVFVGLLVGCSSQTQWVAVNWKHGESIDPLKALELAQWSTPSTVVVPNGRITFQRQIYKGTHLEGTFLKRLYNSTGGLVKVWAQFEKNYLAAQSTASDLAAFEFEYLPQLQKKYPKISKISWDTLEQILIRTNDGWTVAYQIISLSGSDSTGTRILFNKDLNPINQNTQGRMGFDIIASVFPRGPKLSQLQPETLREIRLGQGLFHTNFSVSSTIASSFSLQSTVLDLPQDDPRFDQLQVYFYIAQARDWLATHMGINVKEPLDVLLHVGAPEKSNATFYYQNRIRLGSGDGVTYDRIPHDPSIVIHEYIHHLVCYVAGLPNEGEGGSVNEAIADYLAADILQRPYLGESAYLRGPYRRTVLNNQLWRPPTGRLYEDSQMLSGLLWAVRESTDPALARRLLAKTLFDLTPKSDYQEFISIYTTHWKNEAPAEQQLKFSEVLRARGVELN